MAIDTNGFNGIISGNLAASNAAGLTKLGLGTLTLSGSNAYTGVTTINAGTLNVGSADAFAGGGNITFSGGTLQFSVSNTADYASRIVNSTGALLLDTNAQDVTFAGKSCGLECKRVNETRSRQVNHQRGEHCGRCNNGGWGNTERGRDRGWWLGSGELGCGVEYGGEPGVCGWNTGIHRCNCEYGQEFYH